MNPSVFVLPFALGAVLRVLIGLGAAVYLIGQCRKPSRWVGQFFLWMMNKRHSDLTDWGLQHVQLGKRFAVLDVGCGGGRTIQKLAARATDGKVYGADYAAGSVVASRANNAELIQAGRVAVVRASVSALPFFDGKFDLVTAVETQYFWPDLVNDMKEIRRVLKPGGTLVVIAEAYKGEGDSKAHSALLKCLGSGYLSVQEHQELLAKAGYIDAQVFEERRRRWICVIGRNPDS